MKSLLLYFLIILPSLSSCSVNYYLCETDNEISTFYKKTPSGEKVITIPKGVEVVVKGKSKYRRIKYKDSIGWAYIPSFKSEKKYNYNGYFKITKKRSYSTYSGGTVYVKGYYRKDGTYVRPHTRRK